MTLTPQQIADLKAQADAQALDPLTTQQPFPDTTTPEEIRARIAAKYMVLPCGDANGDAWAVGYAKTWACVNDNDWDDPLDAEAEMEAIIQDEVAAELQAIAEEEDFLEFEGFPDHVIDQDEVKAAMEKME